ncbi:IDEAL domain-containing protein [Bacillus sp. T33-2]|uniref:IDEAL domain-containing protein n=1 Tax=Bacillus sp. T33-2 TaxID=2054168 RepID=UPI000C756E88|nr:IDEAL domain-containing protein [Bacillus sp. T33-2]PLR94665.1 hypothetical protein CVD19_17020 [Bacillus sp. T33-2]
MVTNDKDHLEVGDWIKGKSKHGELIHGYIETIDALRGSVKVNVVASDNKGTIGKCIVTLNKWVEKFHDADTNLEGQIITLIDLALATGDKEWFMELSAKLNSIRQDSEKNESTGQDILKGEHGIGKL